MSHRRKILRLTMSRETALKFGLLKCKHCPWPENNHFDWGKRTCAHDPNCPGYEEVGRNGITVEELQ